MVARRERNQSPRMREAYPQLDIVKAMSAQSRGETLCLFYDEQDRPHGLIEFGVAPDRSQAWLEGEIAMRSMPSWRDPTTIALVANPNGVQRDRRAMLCPQCERRCQKLTWVGSWRCRGCDGLLDRRQLVSPDTRKTEKLAAVQAQLAKGRRKGQHQAVYDRLVAQAEQLARELEGRRPRMPAPEHRIIVRSEWVSIAEYHRRPSVQHLSVPSEQRQRQPVGWLEKLEAKRFQDSRARAGVAPPAPAAAKASGVAFDPNAGRSSDPDEVAVDDM